MDLNALLLSVLGPIALLAAVLVIRSAHGVLHHRRGRDNSGYPGELNAQIDAARQVRPTRLKKTPAGFLGAYRFN